MIRRIKKNTHSSFAVEQNQHQLLFLLKPYSKRSAENMTYTGGRWIHMFQDWGEKVTRG
jgi:hypothetical protein